MRYRLTIAYEGTAFHGWQKQFQPSPDDDAPPIELRTVQSVVERAVADTVREPVDLQGASRTDAGVHAVAQTGAFTTTDDRLGPPDERLALAVNNRLPDDVLVTACARTRDDFDPIGDCLRKGYRYTLHAAPFRPLFERRTVHHLFVDLDVDGMDAAARHLVGEHDFAAFAAAGHGRLSTVRTVETCAARRLDDATIAIDVSGTGFLYNMVRIIAGTLVEVGRGRFTPEDVRAARESRDRRRAGPTLPPTGLCLVWAEYPAPDGVVGEAPA